MISNSVNTENEREKEREREQKWHINDREQKLCAPTYFSKRNIIGCWPNRRKQKKIFRHRACEVHKIWYWNRLCMASMCVDVVYIYIVKPHSGQQQKQNWLNRLVFLLLSALVFRFISLSSPSNACTNIHSLEHCLYSPNSEKKITLPEEKRKCPINRLQLKWCVEFDWISFSICKMCLLYIALAFVAKYFFHHKLHLLHPKPQHIK